MVIGVVGAGIYGCTVAYYLSKFGDDEVVVYERDDVGGTSTAKSAGIVRHHYSHAVHVPFARRGREILESLGSEFDAPDAFHQTGYLLMTDEANREQFERNVALIRDAGVEVELLSPEEVTARVDVVDTEGVAVAAYEPDGGYADTEAVTEAFAREARENGVTFRTQTPVTGFDVDGRTVKAVETPEGRDGVDFVVNAGGPGAEALCEMVDVPLPVRREEIKLAAYEPAREHDERSPVVSDVGTGLYLKPDGDGRFAAGGMNRKGAASKPVEGDELEGVLEEDVERARDLLARRVPAYADAPVERTWSGIITKTPDAHQIIGTPPTLDNFYVVAGASGHGFKEAPGFAEAVARDVLGEVPDRDLAPYRYERYDEGDTFTGGYDEETRA